LALVDGDFFVLLYMYTPNINALSNHCYKELKLSVWMM
jgi:hypothetical protein